MSKSKFQFNNFNKVLWIIITLTIFYTPTTFANNNQIAQVPKSFDNSMINTINLTFGNIIKNIIEPQKNKQKEDKKVEEIINNQDKQLDNILDKDGFNTSLIVNDETMYSLPTKFESSEKIQKYLTNRDSFLANYIVDMSFEDDDDVFVSAPNLKKYNGQKMLFSEFVWKLARTEMGGGCSLNTKSTCTNIESKPINPAFILAMIQRESGLIYGKNAKLDPKSDEAKFLLDRATGYMCNESSDKSKSCWDQNPNWKYYKGIFRQTFYMTRNLMLNTDRCQKSGVNSYGQLHKVGNVVEVNTKPLRLENGITCALYIYTPHIFAQKHLFMAMKGFGVNIGDYSSNKKDEDVDKNIPATVQNDVKTISSQANIKPSIIRVEKVK